MSKDNSRPPYRQRFKGIENFLRRVAFNLGNTPSQTEVKIISCIPIDVTDLQQKINTLEKELHEVRALSTTNRNNRPGPIVQTALGRPRITNSKSKDKTDENTKPPNKCRFKRKKSKVGDLSSVSSRGDNKEFCRFRYSNSIIADITPLTAPDKLTKISGKIVPKRLQKVLKKKRRKTEFVYFAQTSSSPFNRYDTAMKLTNKLEGATTKNILSHAYINNMLRKQYVPELIADKLTDISQISSPICRDSSNGDSNASDISRCYGKYENLDKCYPKRYNVNIGNNNNLPTDPGLFSIHCQQHLNYFNRYYDSENYDIYPVKEKSIKQKKEEIPPRHIKRWNIASSRENFRNKINVNALLLGNYESTNELCDSRHEYTRPYKIYNKNGNEFTVANIKRKRNRSNESHEINPSLPKVCSIDYGNIYVKGGTVANRNQNIKKNTPPVKNVECVTINTTNRDCQTVESKAVQNNIPEENKAEIALNQIKTILQSVLAEVKTNIKANNVLSKPKKDVVVQKDVSHNNITYGSTLLNSFNYNPSYNINPCLATYPRQIPNFYFPNLQSPTMKCMQTFPSIFPNIKLHDCECQYKASARAGKSPILPKPTTATATNTDIQPQTSPQRETVNLIKEIYKSIALNVNYSSKNTSHISMGSPIKVVQPNLNTANTVDVSILEQQSAEQREAFFERPAIIQTCSTYKDNTYTNLESIQSEIGEESKEFANEESLLTLDDRENEKIYNISETIENDNTYQSESKIEDETRESSADPGHTLEADKENEKKEKSGLLHKIIRTVNILKRKKVNNVIHVKKNNKRDDHKTSGSETDSQTIYSYKTYVDGKQSSANDQMATEKPEYLDSVVEIDRENSTLIKEKSRMLSPYMEQEYRRYWDEKLMFHDNQSPLHSSEKSFIEGIHSPQSPVFWRGYEAKTAMMRKSQPKTTQRPTSRFQIGHGERTGLKLEWLKKQKFKTSLYEHS